MTMTDPIADMLTRIRNANTASHDTVEIPASKLKLEIARILKDEGYIENFEKVDGAKGPLIRIELRYGDDRSKTIHGVTRVSKPGLRVYARSGKLPKVLGGMGTAIVSTSSGLMTGKQAARKKLGGEVIAHVW
ncbi:MAG TPA: 30S ribosomal protein S8 [Actinomycetota bacterium]|nr:30S ribosomal protein S8 [Actinomycetota bacterium]